MVAFDAAPFYEENPPRFRGVDDSLAMEHIEGSECCLIHSDNARARAEKGVWLNPNVRVAYASTNGTVNTTYVAVNPEVESGRAWPGRWEMVRGVWGNRQARWFGWVRLWSESGVVRKRVDNWIWREKEHGREVKEDGLECLVNEMQVMFKDGWQHV